MCIYNITVDENKMARCYPGIAREQFGQWLQEWVDGMMEDTPAESHSVSPNAHTYEEMKSAIRDRIDMVESGKATFYTNEEVFSSIRGRYGL